MQTLPVVDSASNLLSLNSELRRQVREEIKGQEGLTNPERFALEQKYGITEPVLVLEELQIIRAEEVRLGK